MTRYTPIYLLLFMALVHSCQSPKNKVLIFSKTEGFRHQSIPEGINCIEQICAELAYKVDTSEDANIFLSDSINQYGAVVFLNTTGNIFDEMQQSKFLEYIIDGGNFVGIHAATDTEMDWDWYAQLVGATFDSHPQISPAKFEVKDKTHPATLDLPETFEFTDEIYNYKSLYSSDFEVLVTIDETSYEGGKHGDFHPISWYRDYKGSRIFYTNLGHRKETYTNPIFLTHLKGGIKYVLRQEN